MRSLATTTRNHTSKAVGRIALIVLVRSKVGAPFYYRAAPAQQNTRLSALLSGTVCRMSDTPRPLARLSEVVLECPDPAELARFYAELLGFSIVYQDHEWCALAADERARPRLSFQRAPGYRPPVWPDPTCSMQVHLDLHVRDLDAAEQVALRLGATAFHEQPSPSDFRVMADPVGHPFCFCLH